MSTKLKIFVLLIPCLLFVPGVAAAEIVPMSSFNPTGVYTGNSENGQVYLVASGMSKPTFGDINSAQTRMVYQNKDNSTLNIYNILLSTTLSIAGVVSDVTENSVFFNNEGKILFVGVDGKLKKMNDDGSNIEVVTSPEVPYSNFHAFAPSPDRSKLAVIEEYWPEGCTIDCRHQRLVAMNADGTGRNVLESYLGGWNNISWRYDNQALFYYHRHSLNNVQTVRYTLFDLSGASVTTTDFSGGHWDVAENACIFTKKGNLLSMIYRELFDGRTGSLIADVSSTMPNLQTGGIMGGYLSTNGHIYFADDAVGTNFHRFIEPGTLYATYTGSGLYKYNGASWARIDTVLPANMVASSSSLYATYTGSGLYKYNGTSWARIDTIVPGNMVASSSSLYATYTGSGLYKYNGTSWARIDTIEPANMAASDTTLYATFTGYGLYKYDGAAWNRIDTIAPDTMAASGSTLYATYSGYGLYKYDGTTWAKLDTIVPSHMVASGSTLYAIFTGYGLYKHNGTSWTRIDITEPTSMAASGTTLYAIYTGSGLYKYDGTTWTRIDTVEPASMAADQ